MRLFEKASIRFQRAVPALGVHALSMLDTPTVVAVVFGTIFVVLAALTAYMLYTCRRREQLTQDQEQNLRQQTYQSESDTLPNTWSLIWRELARLTYRKKHLKPN